jgi:hypothetical protein
MDPTLPASPFFTRFLAESPWTPATLLLLLGGALAWYGAHNEKARFILAGVASLLLAAALLVIGSMWQSPGEAAAEAVRRMVACAEHADTACVASSFAPDATIQFGSNTGISEDSSIIMRAVQTLDGRNRIESNSITRLSYCTVDSTTAQVLLGCSTATASTGGFGSLPTSWWLELSQQPNGEWLVSRIAFLRFANQAASRGTM